MLDLGINLLQMGKKTTFIERYRSVGVDTTKKMKLMRKSYARCLFLMLFVSNTVPAFNAVLSCELSNRHTNIVACFAGDVDTEIKLTNFGQANIYKVWELNSLGSEYQDGLHFQLSDNFRLQVQNASDIFVLRLIIRDDSEQIVFEDVVSQYGVIGVQN